MRWPTDQLTSVGAMRIPGWIDRDDREPAAFPAVITLLDGRVFPVTITNVSKEGCEISCAEVLPIGAPVYLGVAAELIKAQVRWCVNGKAGLRLFDG